MTQKRVPEVRFNGFSDDWEKRELGGVMNVTSVKRIMQSDWTVEGVRFLRARDIVATLNNEELTEYLYISKERYDEYSAISGKVSIGDLLVTGVGTIGVPYLVQSSEPLYFKDGNIIWFQNENKIDGEFLYYLFFGEEVQSFIKGAAGTGTVGTYTIESGKKTPVSLPSKNEQREVGRCVRNIDHIITLHKRKLEKLRDYKKAMLDAMFPKEGETKPKIRFEGFTDDWEEHKLGDILSYKQPKDHIVDSEKYDKGYKTPVLTAGQRFILGYTNEEHGIYRASKHSPAIIFDDFTTSSHYVDFPFKVKSSAIKILFLDGDNFDIYFANSVLRNLDYLPSNHERHWISIFSNFMVMAPSLMEQKGIGLFIQNIDNLITLQEEKIKRLTDFKTSMLDKMFVGGDQ